MRKISFFILIIIALTTSCKKGAPKPIEIPGSNDTLKTVYIAGDTGTYFRTDPTYWKDGIVTRLGDGGYNGYASSIAVSGSDVYVAVDSENVSGSQGVIFVYKNGVRLSRIMGSAASIAVSGQDIYLAGTTFNNNVPMVTYWKNGNITVLGEGYGTSIAVSGADVYVAGPTNNTTTATYWKNGIAVNLPNGNIGTQYPAMAVSGSDVYITANVYTFGAVYWKNSVLTQIGDFHSGTAIGIAVSDTDVYVCGFTGNNPVAIATYWKNRVPVALGNGIATSIAVSRNNVHVCGILNYSIFYWHNGAETYLGNGYASQIALGK